MTTPEPASTPAANRRRHSALITLLAVSGTPVILDPGAIARTPNAFMLGTHSPSLGDYLLTYGWIPVVAMSACILLLTPGLLFAIAARRAHNVGTWLFTGFASSLVSISIAAATVEHVAGTPLTGRAFTILILALGALPAFSLSRRSTATDLPWPLSTPDQKVLLSWLAGGSFVILIILLPKFIWENFNGDGAHTFESSRLLLRQIVPFWDPAAGTVAAWPGTTTMLFAYPISWFIRLIGPIEAATRLPLLIYLAMTAGGIGLLANSAGRVLGMRDNALLWSGLLCFMIAMGFSASYSPYSADMSLSLSQDVLVTACVIAVVALAVDGARGWAVLFGVFAFLTAPNGLLLLVLLAASIAVAGSTDNDKSDVRRQLVTVLIAIGASLLVGLLLPPLLGMAGLPRPGVEHGTAGIMRRFAFLQATDWRRLIYVVVPAGILPALTMAMWPRLDRLSRTVALTALGYFLTFYVQAYLALHHFIPAMLLPLVVYWRSVVPRDSANRSRLHAAYALSLGLAVVLSLPRPWYIDTTARQVGSTIENRLPDYARSNPRLFGQIEVLSALFPFDWHARVPSRSLGGSPLVWNYYSFQADRASSPANYFIQSDKEAAPPGAFIAGRAAGAAAYVVDSTIWKSHLSLRPPTPAGSPIYAVPRWVMFRTAKPDDGYYILSAAQALRKIGIDAAAIRDRLGSGK